MPVPFTLKESMQVRFEMIEPEARYPELTKPNVFFTLFHSDGSEEIGCARVQDAVASQLKVDITNDCIASISIATNDFNQPGLYITSLKIGDITIQV